MPGMGDEGKADEQVSLRLFRVEHSDLVQVFDGARPGSDVKQSPLASSSRRRGGGNSRRRPRTSHGAVSRRERPSRASSSSSSAGQGSHGEYEARAKQLMHMPELIYQKLGIDVGGSLTHRKRKGVARTPFFEACLRKGIDPALLLPKKASDFKTIPGEAMRALSKSERQAMLQHYDRTRLKLLGLALYEETRAQDLGNIATQAKEQRARSAQALLERDRRVLLESMQRLTRSRSKYERVLENENKKIAVLRARQDHSLREMMRRQQRIQNAKSSKQMRRQHKAKMQSQRIRRAKDERRLQDERWRQRQLKRIAHRGQKVDNFLASISGRKVDNTGKEEAKRKREMRRRQARNLEEEKRQELEIKMAHKLENVAHLRKLREAEWSHLKTQRLIRANERLQSVERMRKEQEYAKERRVEEMHEEDARRAQVKIQRVALEATRKALMREEAIRRDKWRASVRTERLITPGPGAYFLED